MNKKINLVFSDDKLANGYDRNEFNRSCIGNWFSLRDEVSFTTEYQIKKDHNNIFVLECSSQLRNFWNQDNEIGDKGIYFDFPKERHGLNLSPKSVLYNSVEVEAMLISCQSKSCY